MQSKLSNLFVGLGCFTPIVGILLLVYFSFHRSILFGCISIVMSLLITTILFVLVSQIEEKRKVKQMEFLQTFQPNQDDFGKYKSFTSYDLLAKIAIDEKHRKVYFWVPDFNKGENVTKAYVGMPYKIIAYNYSAILALKLAEDNHPTASFQRESYFTHFLLDKLNDEETTTSKATHPPVDKISSMDLEIIFNDNVKPKHLIRFYHTPHIRLRKDSPKYHAFFSERQQWFTILQAIIHEAEQTVTAPNIERTIETIELSINEETVKEATQIMMDDNSKHYFNDLVYAIHTRLT